jgi:hypothetical protein
MGRGRLLTDENGVRYMNHGVMNAQFDYIVPINQNEPNYALKAMTLHACGYYIANFRHMLQKQFVPVDVRIC